LIYTFIPNCHNTFSGTGHSLSSRTSSCIRIDATAAEANSETAAETQKDPDTQNANGVAYELVDDRVEKRKKSCYSQASTIASTWAGDPERKSGDFRVVPVDLNYSILVVANGNGGFDVLFEGFHEEVGKNERAYRKATFEVYVGFETYGANKGRDIWNLQYDEDGRNAVGDYARTQGEEFYREQTRNNEYLRSSDQQISDEIRSHQNYDLEYLRAIQSGDTKTMIRLVKQAARNAGYQHRGWHGSPNIFQIFDRSKGNASPDSAQVLGYGHYFMRKVRVQSVINNVSLLVEGVMENYGTDFDFGELAEGIARKTIFTGYQAEYLQNYPEYRRTRKNGERMRDSSQNSRIQHQRGRSTRTYTPSPGVALSWKDTKCFQALESGDMETVRHLVEEAADDAGYESLMYHGAKNGGGFTGYNLCKSIFGRNDILFGTSDRKIR